MAEAVAEKEVCGKCGAEVREGTAFCYACGSAVASKEDAAAGPVEVNGAKTTVDAKSRAALDDLAEKLRADDAPEKGEKLARAADKRKKARIGQRKSRDFAWEPRDDMPVALLIATAGLAVIAMLVILFTVVWK